MEQDPHLFAKIRSVFQNSMLYAQQSKDVLELELTEKASMMLSDIVKTLLVVTLSVIIILFSSLSLAWYIGLCIANMPMGFLIVAILYGLILLIYSILHKGVIHPKMVNYFINLIINEYTHKEP